MKRGAEDMDAEADGSGGRAAKLRSNGDMHEHPEHAPHQLPPPPPRSEFPSGADHNQRERRPWNPLALPEGWEDCPAFGHPLRGIIPSKVPLGAGFKEVVEAGKRYSPDMALRQLRLQHHDIGLVIDLTKTSRYYNPREFISQDIKYMKLPCSGHEAVPDEETVNRFVFEVSSFLAQEQQRQAQDLAQRHKQQQQQQGQEGGQGPMMTQAPRVPKHVFVHCTHGHNRTGYCIIHYLMRWHGGTVRQWVKEFAKARPPGIYKEEYIEELFKFYHEPRPQEIVCPPTPEWKHEGTGVGDEEEDEYGYRKGEEQERLGRTGGSFLDLNEEATEGGGDGEPEPPGHEAAEGRAGSEAGAGRGAGAGAGGEAANGAGGGAEEEVKEMTNDDVLGSAIPEEYQIELQRLVHIAMLPVMDPHSDQHPSTLNLRRLQMFPGSQPVSLTLKNLALLRQRVYHVSWKADGMRYMMLLCPDGAYLIDRNFRFRRLQLRFPSHSSPLGMHNITLLDGEMVIDTTPAAPGAGGVGGAGKAVQQRRYLIYDIVLLNNMPMMKKPFGVRWMAIEDEVMEPRKRDQMKMRGLGPERGLYDYDLECVKVRRKDFWILGAAAKLLRSVIPKLCHESDGLIFQGWNDHYIPRTHEGLLKWKYAHMNSVDFLLRRAPSTNDWVLLLMDRGQLKRLEGAKVCFPGMSDEEAQEKLEGKVVECSWRAEEGVWEYMRMRPDKEHPNAWGTYIKVLDSIHDNITEDKLLEAIENARRLPMYEQHEKDFERAVRDRHRQQQIRQQQMQHHQHKHHHQQHHHHTPQPSEPRH